MITDREREIATLRLKFCTNDEELKRLRKRNISMHINVNNDDNQKKSNFTNDKSGI